MIDFQKETESGTRWRLTLAPNRGVGSVIDGQSIVHEASVSVPLGDLQTRLIAGQIPDWSGYEYLPPTQNKLITHNLLFDFTLPTAYTGAGVEITEGKWIVKAMLANMNSDPARRRAIPAPVIAYPRRLCEGRIRRLRLCRRAWQGSQLQSRPDHWIAGTPTRESTCSRSMPTSSAATGRCRASSATASRRAPRSLPTRSRVHCATRSGTGLSALAAYKFTPRLEGTARFDYIHNDKNGGGLLGYTGYWDPANGSLGDTRNGIGVDPTLDCVTDPTIAECNRGANRSALTFGLSYLFDLNTTFKVEYRLDRANLPVFANVKDGTFRKNNSLLGASVLVSF